MSLDKLDKKNVMRLTFRFNDEEAKRELLEFTNNLGTIPGVKVYSVTAQTVNVEGPVPEVSRKTLLKNISSIPKVYKK